MSQSYAFIVAPSDPASKRAIVKSALKLFARDGYNETNIRAIAMEAGYTNPALFKFFKSKEALGLFLFERCYGRYYAALAAVIRPERSFRNNLGAMITEFSEFLGESPDALLFVQDHLREFWPKLPQDMRKKSILRLIETMLEQAVREKVVGKEVPLKLLGAALVGFLTQFARMHSFGEFNGKPAKWKPAIEAIVLRMLHV
jgi:TetR/AcrR family transcriptional regulator, repressor of fatR-cypB operon